MTFRFNSQEFTRADVGRKLTCVATFTHYFTVGKTYPIVMDGNAPALRTDDGGLIHHSSSDFVFYHQQVDGRKQPKAGEVWAHKLGEFRDNTLYVVEKIKDGHVYNRHIKSGSIHREQQQDFVQDHVFVF